LGRFFFFFFLLLRSNFHRTNNFFLILINYFMRRKKYIAPASEAVGVTLATVVAGSVVPTGTTGPGNKDASETPWKENDPVTGGVGVGGGEFSGDDW